ncbi:MAG: nucleotidyltransferase domain-containing protein [Desulforegulaceae bacterium]|nr:nucleotidyltransferase domain-containing protein [Desulforegulaceae bacterium]
MDELVKKNMDRLWHLCKLYDVEKMYLFGSASSGIFTSSSDIDVLIKFRNIPAEEYADNYFKLHYELEELFGRKVDLVTENSLSNPYFIKSVENTKQIVYAG